MNRHYRIPSNKIQDALAICNELHHSFNSDQVDNFKPGSISLTKLDAKRTNDDVFDVALGFAQGSAFVAFWDELNGEKSFFQRYPLVAFVPLLAKLDELNITRHASSQPS